MEFIKIEKESNFLFSYGGAWQKQDHTYFYLIRILVGILTGLIMDLEILSKYCAQCTAEKKDLYSNTAELDVCMRVTSLIVSKIFLAHQIP